MAGRKASMRRWVSQQQTALDDLAREAVLERVLAGVRERLPVGLQPADLEGFVRRHRPALREAVCRVV